MGVINNDVGFTLMHNLQCMDSKIMPGDPISGKIVAFGGDVHPGDATPNVFVLFVRVHFPPMPLLQTIKKYSSSLCNDLKYAFVQKDSDNKRDAVASTRMIPIPMMPGGWGPSPQPSLPPEHTWTTLLGPYLWEQYQFCYTNQPWTTSPYTALQGKAVVKLYFGSQSCQHYGPFLTTLSALWHSWSDLAIVFVLKCAFESDMMEYFNAMPFWMAMLHAAATGNLGKSLFQRFGLTTIPALVLLDGNGALICTDAWLRLASNPGSSSFPWQAPAHRRIGDRAVVNFDLPPAGVTASMRRLPSTAQLALPVLPDSGKSPSFHDAHPPVSRPLLPAFDSGKPPSFCGADPLASRPPLPALARIFPGWGSGANVTHPYWESQVDPPVVLPPAGVHGRACTVWKAKWKAS